MAQTIRLKRKTGSAGAPTSALQLGEPAVNTSSAKLYLKDDNDVIVDMVSDIIDVTVSAGVYYFNGVRPSDISLSKGQTYLFRQTSVDSTHKLIFTEGSAHDSTEYTTGVTHQIDSGDTLATEIKVALDAPTLGLYINCANHTGMGVPINFVIRQATLTAYQNMKDTLGGGGTVSVDSNGRFKWTQRFITVGIGQGDHSASYGFINIEMPTEGHHFTEGLGGGSATWTSDGIILNQWSTLYAIHEVGADYTDITQAGHYKTIGIGASVEYEVPFNYIPIVTRHGDETPDLWVVHASGGYVLESGESTNDEGRYLPSLSDIGYTGAANANYLALGTTSSTALAGDTSIPAGTVTSVAAGGGLTGNTITNTGTISHGNTSDQESLSVLTGANVVSDIDLDSYGHVTNLSTRAIASGNGGLVPAQGTANHYLAHNGSFAQVNYNQLAGNPPAIALTDVHVESTESAQLNLTVQEGDVAIRTDLNKSYVALNSDNDNMADWAELLSGGGVISVNGRSGTVDIVNVSTESTEASLLAISSPFKGDIVVVTDDPTSSKNGTYVHNGGTANAIADWTAIGASLDLSAVSQHIVPFAADTYDIGSATKPFKDLYLTAGSLHLGDESISIDPTTADLAIGTTIDGEAVTKKVAAFDPSGNLEISGSLNVTGTIEGPSVKNSGFLGSTYESKNINYTHITPATGGTDGIVTSDLVVNINANDTASYSGSGTAITAHTTESGQNIEGTMQSAVTVNGNAGSKYFTTVNAVNNNIAITHSGGTQPDGNSAGSDVPDLEYDHTEDFTFEAWIKTTESTNSSWGDQWGILADSTGGVTFAWGYNGAGKPKFRHYNGGWEEKLGTTSINDGNWHHLVMTNVGSEAKLKWYVDGALEDGYTDGVAWTFSGSYTAHINTALGTYGGHNIAADVSAIRVYDVTLTAEQIGLNYAGGFNGYLAGVAGDPQTVTLGTTTATVPTGSVYYTSGNVGIGTEKPVATLDVAGSLQQHSKYATENDMRIKVDAANRAGTTGVIGSDLHYVDASGNLQETMRVDTDTADASTYSGFNITTNITQTQQTGWGETGSTQHTGYADDTPATVAGGDEHWDNVVVLMQGNADSATSLTDLSETPGTVTVEGTVTHSTTSKHMSHGWTFNGSGAIVIDTGDEDAFAEDSDFTIEVWGYFTGFNPWGGQVWRMLGGGGTNPWTWGPHTTQGSNMRVSPQYESAFSMGTLYSAQGIFRHIVLTRQNGNLDKFVDGVTQGAQLYQSQFETKMSIDQFSFGGPNATPWGGELMYGAIDQVRLTKNVCRYPDRASFTPPEIFPIGPVTVAQDAIPGGPVYSFVPDGGVYFDEGNVGLGTTAPNHQLDVAGNINASGEILQNGQALMTQDDVPKQYWLPFDETYGVGDTTTGDDHYNDVSLLMHMNGADGGTTFEDHSSFDLAIAQAGTIVDDVQPTVKIETGTSAFNVDEVGGITKSNLIFNVNANDTDSYSGSGTDITAGGSYTGTIGSAVGFNGDAGAKYFTSTTADNSWITIGTGPKFLHNVDFTLEAWVRTDQSNTEGYFDNWSIFGDVTNNIAHGWGYNGSGKPSFVWYNGYQAYGGSNPEWVTILGDTTINDGEWHHLVMTNTGTGSLVRWYVDGVIEPSFTNGSTWGPFPSNSPDGMHIHNLFTGYGAGGNEAAAAIDADVSAARVYDTPLTAEQVLVNYQGGAFAYDEPVPAVNTPANLSKYGIAMADFRTANSYLSVADHAGFNFGTSDFTAEAWVKPTTSSITTITTNDLTSGGGGSEQNYSIDNTNYVSHTFTSGTSTFTTDEDLLVDIMIVAGGGGGGGYSGGGGGGAGGMLVTLGHQLTAGESYTVTVGAGGAGAPNTGGPSSYYPGIGDQGQNSVFGDLVATGGGGGVGRWSSNSLSYNMDGGSGGGRPTDGDGTVPGGTGIAGQGYDGGAGNSSGWYYNGGGGGGAAAAGGDGDGTNDSSNTGAGDGGDGLANNFRTGSDITYAGGGGGGSFDQGNSQGVFGTGGDGGGGAGSKPGTSVVSGTANTGGGGGGTGFGHQQSPGCAGGNGGSGIVVIRFAESSSSTTIAAGGGGIFQLGKDSLKMSVTNSKILVQNNATALITGTTDLVEDVWSHIAVSRFEGNVKAFLNGEQEGSTVTDSTHDFNSNNLLNIGLVQNAAADGNGGYTYTDHYYNSYMDEFRITKGTGRYSATFPVPVQEFGNQKPLVVGDQSYNNVSLSTHMNGVEGGKTFTDSGPISHDIIVPEGSNVYTKQLVPAVAGSSITETDPDKLSYWDNVILHLDGESTSDLSSNGVSITGAAPTSGLGRWSTSENPTYGYSITGGGQTNNTKPAGGMSIPSGTLDLSGDFTIQYWVKYTESQTHHTVWAFDYYKSGANDLNGQTGANNHRLHIYYAGSEVAKEPGAGAPVADTWYYYQITRTIADGALKVYRDGVQTTSGTVAGTISTTDYQAIGYAHYGVNGAAMYSFGGYIDDFMITNDIRPIAVPTEDIASPSSITETVTDANWSDTVLLIQSGSEQDTSNSFSDTGGSAYTHNVSQTGGVIHSEDTAKFGTSSIKFTASDGFSNGNYLTLPDHADFSFATDDDWTIEMWIYPESKMESGNYTGLIGTGTSWASGNARFVTYSGKLVISEGDYNTNALTGNTDLTEDMWHHVAAVRSGSTLKLYLNGTEDGTKESAHAYDFNVAEIGRYYGDSSNWFGFNGYMEEIRITKGVARYSADFSATLPAGPYGATYTQYSPEYYEPTAGTLLITGKETVAENAFTDTTTNYPVVVTNAVVVDSSIQEKAWSFNGTDAYLNVVEANTTGLAIDANEDFTIEGWFNFSDVTTRQGLWSAWGGGSDSTRIRLEINKTAGKFSTTLGSNADDWSASHYTFGSWLEIGKWYHIALVREGTAAGCFRLYVNGGLLDYYNHTGAVGNFSSAGLSIGANVYNTDIVYAPMNGYVADFNWTKGTAKYTEGGSVTTGATFTPPSTYNTASWDTTTITAGVPGYTPKFGIASASFDGDGDKLTVAADDSFTFDEDYTVEGWVKTTMPVGVSYPAITSDGTVTEEELGGSQRKIYAYLGDGTFSVAEDSNIDIMVIGAGGPGGADQGGGGGAGGLIYIEDYPVTAGADYNVVVGDTSGPMNTTMGTDPRHYLWGGPSTFGNGTTLLTAEPGGTGGFDINMSTYSRPAYYGGSGGGMGRNKTVWAGDETWPGNEDGKSSWYVRQAKDTNDGVNTYADTGFGEHGGSTASPGLNPRNAAGGGGAGGDGQDSLTNASGAGGAAKDMSAIFGTTYGVDGWFAGGGGGAAMGTMDTGYGGAGSNVAGDGGGGGAGAGGTSAEATSTPNIPPDALPNTGSGGGGGWGDNNTSPTRYGGSGGSGIVLIRATGVAGDYPSIITTGTTSLELGQDGYIAGCESVSGTKNYITSTGVKVNDDAWHHVAISRNTGVTRLFVDGTLQTETRASTETFTTTGVIIGSDTNNNDFQGSLDDIRITKGVGRYTENFTAPVLQNGDVLQVGDVIPVTDDIYYTGGKVGFGTTNPDYTVDVTGSVNTTGGFYDNGTAVETLKRTDAGDAQYDGNVEVTGELKIDSWTIKQAANGDLILVKSDGTEWEIGLTQIT